MFDKYKSGEIVPQKTDWQIQIRFDKFEWLDKTWLDNWFDNWFDKYKSDLTNSNDLDEYKMYLTFCQRIYIIMSSSLHCVLSRGTCITLHQIRTVQYISNFHLENVNISIDSKQSNTNTDWIMKWRYGEDTMNKNSQTLIQIAFWNLWKCSEDTM